MTKKQSTLALKTSLKQAVLTVLIDGPKTTLKLEALSCHRWWHHFRFYVDLRDLEQQGLITSYFDEKRLPERGGLRRRYYCLTRFGRNQLIEEP